ncbi:FecR domain-containing protein [Chitinophaga oryzae]|uniref:FecR domain-containing protein n=1 Tax=Chitinophaga oryzae TaxID=2725414 RepID=A0AAE6ZLC7_9BACT|nr:FecR family protein [Chitinophaga oryzae]QJB34867.1 FecR domain-containing protein [Chitinophaga oryzae]QJB41379.1 FecR domain-containing protein [Chitinophaga oryzae]
MDKNTFHELVNRYLDGTATTAEQALVDRYCEQLETAGETELEPEAEALLQQVMYDRIMRRIQAPRKRFYRWTYAAAAAAVLAIVAVGGVFFFPRKQPPAITVKEKSVFHNDIEPGGNKATLTLANGSTVVLDDVVTDTLAPQGNSRITRTGNGQLAYQAQSGVPGKPVYNTLTTPAGGQFRLTLPDGSKVWLNAASSITFPTAFTGKDRTVELKGEAYLEVSRNPQQPFKVKVRDMEVSVLGTHFNINAYPDEKGIRTTLLEGSVRVNNEEQSYTLKPGQQAQLQPNGQFSLHTVDTEDIIAWKDGQFAFDDADIHTVMRQVARWYGAEVIYEGNVSHHFMGTIPRDVPVSRLLKMLELTGRVSFVVDGNKIIVKP